MNDANGIGFVRVCLCLGRLPIDAVLQDADAHTTSVGNQLVVVVAHDCLVGELLWGLRESSFISQYKHQQKLYPVCHGVNDMVWEFCVYANPIFSIVKYKNRMWQSLRIDCVTMKLIDTKMHTYSRYAVCFSFIKRFATEFTCSTHYVHISWCRQQINLLPTNAKLTQLLKAAYRTSEIALEQL